MAQDFYDPLQPFDYIVGKLEDYKATLGLAYIGQLDDELIPEYPAVLVQIDQTERERHATHVFLVTFHLDLFVFHAEMTVDKATRSRKDIQLATDIRKLLHSDKELGGHIVQSFVSGEFPGITSRRIAETVSPIVTTRLTWEGENRVLYRDS